MDTMTDQHKDLWQVLSEANGPALDAAEVRSCAFMQEVKWVDTYVMHGNTIHKTPNKGALMRSDGTVVGEGLGRGSYTPVQPEQVYEFGREVQMLTDWPLVAAGSLRDGRQFFFTYQGEPVQQDGVPMDPMTTIISSHDGTLPLMALHSVFVQGTPLAATVFSHNDRTSLKHTVNMEDRGLKALAAVRDSLSHTTHCGEVIRQLLSVKIQTQSVIDALLPKVKGATRAAALRSTARTTLDQMVEVRDLGNELNGWEFVQLVADYESWVAPVRNSTAEDNADEAVVRAVRQFDAVVRTKQALTQDAVVLARMG